MDIASIRIDENLTGHGYAIAGGPVNLVCVISDYGIAACGLVDVGVYDRFGLPAVCAKNPAGLINTPEELLDCPVVKVNSCASCLGIKPGKSARATLSRMRALVLRTRHKA